MRGVKTREGEGGGGGGGGGVDIALFFSIQIIYLQLFVTLWYI